MYNTGAQVLGVLAARAAGQPFNEVLKTRIFEPLGISDTGFCRRTSPASDGLPAARAGWWSDEPGGKWSRPPVFGDGAAGLVSTVDDLLAFAQMLLAAGCRSCQPTLSKR